MNGSHIELFAGVSMTSLAAEKLGFQTIATAESDPWCRKVLKARHPDALHYSDVREVHHGALLAKEAQRPLLISGGFPCQDVASPGTGLGLAGSRSGLWSEFARVIGEFHPDYVLIENSPMLRSRGLDTILADLWRMGYAARWDCIPAAALGAPHLRDRIYIVAWPEPTPDFQGGSIHFRCGGGWTDEGHKFPRAGHMHFGTTFAGAPQYPLAGLRKLTRYPTPTKSDGSGGPGTTPKRTGGKNLRTVVAEQAGNGRLNPIWVEWLMGLPLHWTDPEQPNMDWIVVPWDSYWAQQALAHTVEARFRDRSKRIKALGNGLVPQAALAALKMIPGLEGAIHA